jgi:hypothetical protein
MRPFAYIGHEVGWDEDKLWEHKWNILKQHLTKEPARVKEYIGRLERVNDLWPGLSDKFLPKYQNYLYLLAWLYTKDHQADRAIAFLMSKMEELQSYDIRLTELWTELKLLQGKTGEARKHLEASLEKLTSQDVMENLLPVKLYESLKSRASYEAMLRRSLARVYLQEMMHSPISPEELLYDQYLLSGAPRSSLALGEYHYQREDYPKSLTIFHHCRSLMPDHGEPYLWLARVYTKKGELGEAAIAIKSVYEFQYLTTIQELDAYPELKWIQSNPDFQQWWKANYEKK